MIDSTRQDGYDDDHEGDHWHWGEMPEGKVISTHWLD
jgi:hypothetical protein